MNIANLLEEQKRLSEAYEYAYAANATYKNVYNDDNPNTMKVNWQLLTICYALNKENTEQEAEKLLHKLQQRDQSHPPYDKEVESIKLSVVATLIM